MDEIDEQLSLAAGKLADLKADVALLQLGLALKKFDPNEPRWVRGTPGGWGGRWRRVGDTAAEGETAPAQVATFTRIGVYDESKMPGCLEQMALDEAVCRRFGRDRCWQMMNERYHNCMKNLYIPPLGWGGR
jgi:hypothetical protein